MKKKMVRLLLGIAGLLTLSAVAALLGHTIIPFAITLAAVGIGVVVGVFRLDLLDKRKDNPMLCCDGCGYTQSTPLIAVRADVPGEEIERFAQHTFIEVKRHFGEQGWFTSVGYDLCPTCCKRTGTQPGYRENGLSPETNVLPK